MVNFVREGKKEKANVRRFFTLGASSAAAEDPLVVVSMDEDGIVASKGSLEEVLSDPILKPMYISSLFERCTERPLSSPVVVTRELIVVLRSSVAEVALGQSSVVSAKKRSNAKSLGNVQ